MAFFYRCTMTPEMPARIPRPADITPHRRKTHGQNTYPRMDFSENLSN